MITYPRANARKCSWLCRDCLKGHATPCKPSNCPDYVPKARVERERQARERKGLEQVTRRTLTE